MEAKLSISSSLFINEDILKVKAQDGFIGSSFIANSWSGSTGRRCVAPVFLHCSRYISLLSPEPGGSV